MRVALAAALFAEPEVLLLDEPTNYLDLEGTIWLQNFLRSYRYTVIVISHDRDLLNISVGSILHLDQLKLTLYQGNYDTFDRQRREQQALQLKLKKKQDDQRRHMEAFVERFRYKASKARQAQSRLKALSRLEPVAAMAENQVAPFVFPAPQKSLSPPIRQVRRHPGLDMATARRSCAISTCGLIRMTGSDCSAPTVMANRPSQNCCRAAFP